MNTTVTQPEQLETCERLIEAATAVFAEEGFRRATIREICRRAGANVAAINYHFRDKKHLYLEVLHHALEGAIKKYPPDLGVPAGAPPEERLNSFIRAFLLRIFDHDYSACHGKLMTREMIEPTPALDEMVDTVIRPMAELLFSIVGELLGPGATEQEVHWAGASVVSQCLYYQHCRPTLMRLVPEQQYEPADIEQLAGHVTRFSLGALRAMAAEIAQRASSPATAPALYQ